MKKTSTTIDELRNWFEENGWVKGNQEDEIIYYKKDAYAILKKEANAISYADLGTGFSTSGPLSKISIDLDGSLEFRTKAYILAQDQIAFLKHFHEEQR